MPRQVKSGNMHSAILAKAASGQALAQSERRALSLVEETAQLMVIAADLRDKGHGNVISYSRKVFIPLTHLCRDVCHYCTFARPPRAGERAYLPLSEISAVARAGVAAGCTEALFTLGDKPERRYRLAREELAALGHQTTLSYLAEAAREVLKIGGIFPHLNPGLMSAQDLENLRPLSVSMGVMLEGLSPHLEQKGGAHYGSPDKAGDLRLQTIGQAGQARVPFTSGILIGLGETREERIAALLALRDLHNRYGHIQEIIIQNFRAKAGTRMATAAEPSLEDHLWTIAMARILFGPTMNIQAPPNLAGGPLVEFVRAGINDWGGVSPLTPDYVNPEAAWPHLDRLEMETRAAGKQLVQRLPIYPNYVQCAERWLAPEIQSSVLTVSDAAGYAAAEAWRPGVAIKLPAADVSNLYSPATSTLSTVKGIINNARTGIPVSESDIVELFNARGEDFTAVCRGADDLRQEINGQRVSYVVTRNINYTNMCTYKCGFCAFSKGKRQDSPYDLSIEEIERRCVEAWDRGASEVCMQGGIHPSYTGATYLKICGAVKRVCPELHVHAFSPLEVTQGARTLGISIGEFLAELKRCGLNTLPGTAAEILDDEIRAIICPDKLNTQAWLDVMETAHGLGLRSTATIMFGHVERPINWARHLLRLKALQIKTGGFTEFVPLPFVHMQSPIYLRGQARKGPTFRETILMHAVARLVLHPHISNIQVSWVKLGADGARAALKAGVNDLGGTLMNESISKAAGASFGQEMNPWLMESLITDAGRQPFQRTTLYGAAAEGQRLRSLAAKVLTPQVNNVAVKRRVDHAS